VQLSFRDDVDGRQLTAYDSEELGVCGGGTPTAMLRLCSRIKTMAAWWFLLLHVVCDGAMSDEFPSFDDW